MKHANYFLNRLFAECCFLFKRLFLLFTQLTYNSIYGDYYLDSEMMIGLCPVSNTAQVQNVLHKILNYKPIPWHGKTICWMYRAITSPVNCHLLITFYEPITVLRGMVRLFS